MKGSQTQKQTKNNAGKLLSGKHLAYKAIFLADGVVFLFEDVKPFTDEEVKINPYNGDLFLELGHNVALITEKVLHHLIETKHVFLYKSGYLGYEAKEQAIALEVESEVLARIRGAWEVAKRMLGSTTT